MMLLRSVTGHTTRCTHRQPLCYSLRRQQRQLTVNSDHVFYGYHHRFGDTSTKMFSTTTTGSNNDDVSTTTSTVTVTVTNNNNNELPHRTKILSLYRSILRLHQKALPKQLRDMGNVYIQSEFRTLKDTTGKKVTMKHVQSFIIEWEKYQQQILYQYNNQQQQQTVGGDDDVTASTTTSDTNNVKYGQSLPSDIPLTTEQQEQLRKIHQEVTSTSTNSTTQTSSAATMINAIITKDNKLG